VDAIVTLASSLGMTTTAEGVETVEQLAQVRRAGCTEAQGYHLGRPRPAADVFADLVRRDGKRAGAVRASGLAAE
jgi:EAL domain-containing protein (putative c-di-GMP-specific phosphodiesterase class I)